MEKIRTLDSPITIGDFLGDLRSNRPQRPMGTRPLPWLRAAASKPELNTPKTEPPDIPPVLERSDLPIRSGSALSFRQDSSKQLDNQQHFHTGRPLVRQPSNTSQKQQDSGKSDYAKEQQANIPYVENGQRWMERQESRSISMALRDMDLKEEQKLHSAAQDEASELVWKNQNSGVPYRNPDAAKYKTHLRKGSHARAHSIERLELPQRRISQSEQFQTSDNSSSTEDGRRSGQSSRVPSDSSLDMLSTGARRSETKPQSVRETSTKSRVPARKPYSDLAESVARDISTHRRTSSGTKRKPSGGASKSLFKDPNDQIYEEPEEVQRARIADPRPPPMPLSMRRNPFARVKFAQQEKHERSNSEPILNTEKFNRYEIHKNPPSQSRNPGYTSNTSTPPRPSTPKNNTLISNEDSPRIKDGKEVRGEDIRAATSMKMKDRSPKLPTPSVVSDKPGRPIVSFDRNWKPKEVELKEEMGKAAEPLPKASENERKLERPSPAPTKAATTTDVPTLNVLDIASRERAHSPPPAIHNDTMETSIVVPVINVNGPPQVPSINEPEASATPSYSHPEPPLMRSKTTPLPTISVPDEIRSQRQQTLPTINVADDLMPRSKQPSIPTINIPDQPRDSSKQRPLPVINTAENSIASAPPRPLPTISRQEESRFSSSRRPLPAITAPSSHHSDPKPSTRPLPQPSSSAARPNSLRHAFTASAVQMTNPSAPHWTPSPRRTHAECAQCALPIAGCIVSAANQRFHPECFTCHHCGEGLECVAFYPEPETARAERVDRIRRRQAGEVMTGGASEFDDGHDEYTLRFYCHLDFHEFFSPRCKSCKTPIEGEVVVACGAEWHVGHFFCAQCGDPFDAQTPFVEKDGYAWCVGCHTNRYSTKCRKCRRPVTEVVVKALGAEWHQECFVCMVSLFSTLRRF